MYLYFNREGILTTSIPHGSPVRQGSSLEIVVCLDCPDRFNSHENYDPEILYNCQIELVLPNGDRGTAQAITAEPPTCKVFRKTKDSEITYDLVDGRKYWTYTFRFEPEQATVDAGILEANVSMWQLKEVEDGELEFLVDDEYKKFERVGIGYFGTAKIFVERTLGDATITEGLAIDHYNNIVKQINALNAQTVEWKKLANYAVYIATADRENVKRVEVKQDDDTFNVVYNLVPFEEQKGNFVGKSIDKALQTSDLVVDPGIVNNIPYVWNTVNGKLVVTPINTLLVGSNFILKTHNVTIKGEGVSIISEDGEESSDKNDLEIYISLYNYVDTPFAYFSYFTQKTSCNNGSKLFIENATSGENILSFRYVSGGYLIITTDVYNEYKFKVSDLTITEE